MELRITLTGKKAERFIERKEALEDELGTELSRPQAFDILVERDEDPREI